MRTTAPASAAARPNSASDPGSGVGRTCCRLPIVMSSKAKKSTPGFVLPNVMLVNSSPAPVGDQAVVQHRAAGDVGRVGHDEVHYRAALQRQRDLAVEVADVDAPEAEGGDRVAER